MEAPESHHLKHMTECLVAIFWQRYEHSVPHPLSSYSTDAAQLSKGSEVANYSLPK